MKELIEALDAIGAETTDTMERFMGDTAMYTKYVLAFPKEPTMNQLVEAMNAKDYEEAKRAVHALKGIANNLGFLPLADAAIELLEALRENRIDDANTEYPLVQASYQKFCDVIQSFTK